MHPVVAQWQWGGHTLTLASYGLCLFLAIVVGAVASARLGRLLAPARWWWRQCFLLALIGLLGAKLLHGLVLVLGGLPPAGAARSALGAGGVWLGGPVLALCVFVPLVRSAGLEWRSVARPLLVALPLAHAVGRVGCLLAGCCFGTHSSLPFAVIYSHPAALAMGAPPGVALHPVPLYEAMLELGNAALLLWAFRRQCCARTMLAAWLALYGCQRFALEFLRGDERGLWWGISTSQWLCMLMLLAAIALIARVPRQMRAGSPIQHGVSGYPAGVRQTFSRKR